MAQEPIEEPAAFGPILPMRARPALETPLTFRMQPNRALAAMKRLAVDKNDTEQVFELIRALAGRSMSRGYQRLLASVTGGQIAYEREELAERLSEKEWLSKFEPGSVGAAYRDFMEPSGLSASGLAAENRKIQDSQADAAHPYVWYERRLRDIHDIWHVLTGYGADTLGEVCLVAFSYSQTRSAGFGAIALTGMYKFSAARNGYPYVGAILQAWNSGRRAAWLPELNYPELFALPLESARARLKISRPHLYERIPPSKREQLTQDDLVRRQR